MRTKKRHGFLIFIFVLLAVLLVFGVLLSLGLFSKQSIVIDDLPTSTEEPLVLKERTVIRPAAAVLPGIAAGSGDMNGVWIDLSTDIPEGGSTENILSELYGLFLASSDADANTFFIKPDVFGRFDNLLNADGTPIDIMGASLSYAAAKNGFRIAVADDAFLTKNGAFTFAPLEHLLSAYDFEAVLYTGSGVNDAGFYKTAERLKNNIEVKFPSVCFGCELYSDAAFSPQTDTTLNSYFERSAPDFVCVSSSSLTGGANQFGVDMAKWNGFAAGYPGVVFYAVHSLDRVAQAASPGKEMSAQLLLTFEQENFSGRAYRSAARLRSSQSIARSVSEFCYREPDENVFSVRSLTFSDDGTAAIFGGVTKEGAKTICAGTLIDEDGGPFAVAYPLAFGENRIKLKGACFSESFTVERIANAAAGQTPSPYTDNGLGRALMCRVTADPAQAVASSGDYDTYHPDQNDLPTGTLDYVNAITYDDGLRYELASGVSVWAADCSLLYNAYRMPDNRVTLVSAEVTERGSLRMVLSTDWSVPVSFTLSPQSYRRGYLGFSYNVDDFTAEYLDVVFHYTDAFGRIDQLNLDRFSLLSGFETLSNETGEATLRFRLNTPGVFYGVSVDRDINGNIVITVKGKPTSLDKAKVMLDPGHGGAYMTGTALNDESLAEKAVTLDIAKKTAEMLRAQGIEVQLTREYDVSLTLKERSAFCRAYDPDVFVSIHCDGVDDMGQSGTHSFYFKPYSQPLAECVHRKLVDVYANVIYTSIDKNYDQIDKSIKYYPFYVTRVDLCPSILVESGFMSNDYEGRILADENCRYWIADAIAAGIVDYLQNP